MKKEYDFSSAKRGPALPAEKGKTRITIRVDSDILDWFHSGKRLGHPKPAMWNDPASEALNEKAMKGSRNWDERVSNFRAYHETAHARAFTGRGPRSTSIWPTPS